MKRRALFSVPGRERCRGSRGMNAKGGKGGRMNELLARRRRHFANTDGHLVMGMWVRGGGGKII